MTARRHALSIALLAGASVAPRTAAADDFAVELAGEYGVVVVDASGRDFSGDLKQGGGSDRPFTYRGAQAGMGRRVFFGPTGRLAIVYENHAWQGTSIPRLFADIDFGLLAGTSGATSGTIDGPLGPAAVTTGPGYLWQGGLRLGAIVPIYPAVLRASVLLGGRAVEGSVAGSGLDVSTDTSSFVLEPRVSLGFRVGRDPTQGGIDVGPYFAMDALGAHDWQCGIAWTMSTVK